jgi:retron-type reverse transcriptase
VSTVLWILAAGVAAALLQQAVVRVGHATAGRPVSWLRARFGRGRSLEALARRLGVTVEDLRDGAPVYRELLLPKRRGGHRLVHAPDNATKALQRRILRRLLAGLKVHPAALGFRKGASIVDHARRHAGKATVLRLDVVDFFPSTKAARVERYFRAIGWDAEAAATLARWTTHDGGLPQGAPTSPALSNLVNHLLDVQLTTLARRTSLRAKDLDVAYSRYADDITFSLSREHPVRRTHKRGRGIFVRGLVQRTERLLKAHGYTLHRGEKLKVRRAHQRQVVTGLVVNDEPALPREVRRRLRAIRHHVATDRPATLTAEQLAGWTALEAMIERGR